MHNKNSLSFFSHFAADEWQRRQKRKLEVCKRLADEKFHRRQEEEWQKLQILKVIHSKPKKEHLLQLLEPIAAQWEEIGAGLYLSPRTIEGIKLNNKKKNPKFKLSDALQIWLDNTTYTVSWTKIIDVVGSPPVDRPDIAEEMKKFLAKSENYHHYRFVV